MEATIMGRDLSALNKLNVGCGNRIYEGMVNADLMNPLADLQMDMTNLSNQQQTETLNMTKIWPFPDERFGEVHMIHCIEHTPYRQHIGILEEAHRVLKPDGRLVVGYPEFEICVENFLKNKSGKRWSWWVQTLYGSQENQGQFHVAPVTRENLSNQLIEVGFGDLKYELTDADAAIEAIKQEPLPWY